MTFTFLYLVLSNTYAVLWWSFQDCARCTVPWQPSWRFLGYLSSYFYAALFVAILHCKHHLLNCHFVWSLAKPNVELVFMNSAFCASAYVQLLEYSRFCRTVGQRSRGVLQTCYITEIKLLLLQTMDPTFCRYNQFWSRWLEKKVAFFSISFEKKLTHAYTRLSPQKLTPAFFVEGSFLGRLAF